MASSVKPAHIQSDAVPKIGLARSKAMDRAGKTRIPDDRDAAVLPAVLPIHLMMRWLDVFTGGVVMRHRLCRRSRSNAMRAVPSAMISIGTTTDPGRNGQHQADRPHQIRHDSA